MRLAGSKSVTEFMAAKLKEGGSEQSGRTSRLSRFSSPSSSPSHQAWASREIAISPKLLHQQETALTAQRLQAARGRHNFRLRLTLPSLPGTDQSHLTWKGTDQSSPGQRWTGREPGLGCVAATTQILLTLLINHRLFDSIFHRTIGRVSCQFTLPVNELFLFKLRYVKAASEPRTFTHSNPDLQKCSCEGKSWTNTARWLLPGQPVPQPDYRCEPPRGKQDILCIW